MQVTYVVLEVASIQKYIFQSNRLQANAGASYIVDAIFDDLPNLLKQLELRIPHPFDYWKNEPNKQFIQNEEYDVDVGFIGGGNCFLIFKDKQKAIEFIRAWSLNLLYQFPGLQVNAAFEQLELSDLKEFSVLSAILFDRLTTEKESSIPITTFPKFGFNADCSQTGLSAEVVRSYKQSSEQLSASFTAKLDAFSYSERAIQNKFLQSHSDDYKFPKDFQELGSVEGKFNTLAVVHIDGNSMGKRFQNPEHNLASIRELSDSVENIASAAMKKVIDELIAHYQIFADKLNLTDGYLPLRPIIVGGDDITYVTHGLLGIYTAERFLHYLSDMKAADGMPMSACAGVSISKPKFPFYRSYQIAEELCQIAKQKARQQEGTSWLDFHIGYTGHYSNIPQVRKQQFRSKNWDLLMRPLLVHPKDGKLYSLNILNEGKKQFISSENAWPQTKIAELQNKLYQDPGSLELFVKEMKAKDLVMPSIDSLEGFSEKGYAESQTPYFDIIELTQFYPSFLDEIGAEKK